MPAEPEGVEEPKETAQAKEDGDTQAMTCVEDVVRELASHDGATFRQVASVFRDFAILCRQNAVPSAHIDIIQFRRLFACELGGLNRLEEPARTAVDEIAQRVEEDVLAPYLAMAVASALGEDMPDEEELALLYGSSSPSRVRRMLDHLERAGLIVVREEFGGDRNITVPGISDSIEAGQAA